MKAGDCQQNAQILPSKSLAKHKSQSVGLLIILCDILYLLSIPTRISGILTESSKEIKSCLNLSRKDGSINLINFR